MAEVSIKVFDNDRYREGEVINIWTDEDIENTWCWKLITGLHSLPDIPFDTDLYKKYFKRYIIDRKTDGRNRKELIQKPDCNFRVANERLGKLRSALYRYVDIQQVNFEKPLQKKIKYDVYHAFGWISLKHALSDKLITECWPWGKQEVKHCLLGYIPDSEFNNRLHAKSLIDRGIGNRKRLYRLNFRNELLTDLKLDENVGSHFTNNGHDKALDFVKDALQKRAFNFVIKSIKNKDKLSKSNVENMLKLSQDTDKLNDNELIELASKMQSAVSSLSDAEKDNSNIMKQIKTHGLAAGVQSVISENKVIDLLDDREFSLPVRFWVKLDKKMFTKF